MKTKANCKINIGLDVIRRREDGFHDLETIMIPVAGLFDVVDVEPLDDSSEVIFRTLGVEVDCAPEDNLCVRAARLMQREYGVGGVSITLDKRIPFGAGMGGGSADATTIIVAMNDLFNLELSEAELIERASQLGSDTAFFVRNTPQLCSGRGEIMEPISLPLDGMTLVIIKPEGVNISTREAYAGVRPALPATPLQQLATLPIEMWQESIKNDFEPHIFEAYPLLSKIKSELLDEGALYAAMSGSGSTIFGIFDSPTKIVKSEKLKRYSPFITTIAL